MMSTGNLNAIVNLPTEIQLEILALLDVQSLLAIRQTCRHIYQVTHEKLIWLSLFDRQRQYLPLPHDLVLQQENHHLPSSLVESMVKQAQLVANVWPRPRTTAPQKLKHDGLGSTLMGVEMFLDRWLVVVYSEGALYIYDTQPTNSGGKNPHGTVILRSYLIVLTGSWSSYAISPDPIANKLVLAILYPARGPPYGVLIYEVQLTPLSSNNDVVHDAFKIIRTTTVPSYKTVRAVNTKERIVALSCSSTVELVKFDEDPISDQNERNLVIESHSEDLEDLIIAIHFMGPYILIFKTRSIELHDFISLLDLHSSKPSTKSTMKHCFTMTYRDVSFSNCSHSHNRISETDTYTTTLFAYDVIQGLFQYVVQLTLSSSVFSTFPPSLQVTLKGIYPLVATHSGRIPVSSSAGNTPMALTNPILTYSAHFSPALVRNASEGNRGFVSAHAMGPQGKRAIWIERKRSSTMREVQVWNEEPSLTGGSDSTDPIEIERKVVYSVNSYDLREDVKFCAFSELTGKIVLGKRSGDLSILDLST